MLIDRFCYKDWGGDKEYLEKDLKDGWIVKIDGITNWLSTRKATPELKCLSQALGLDINAVWPNVALTSTEFDIAVDTNWKRLTLSNFDRFNNDVRSRNVVEEAYEAAHQFDHKG